MIIDPPLEDIVVIPTGYYWDFPEVLYTWGKALKGAYLVEVRGETFSVFLRMRKTQATVASWYGDTSAEAAQELKEALDPLGVINLKFLPTSNDELKVTFPKGYKVPTYFTTCSWKNMGMSRNRRWQLTKATKLYELVSVECNAGDVAKALNIVEIWKAIASTRQRLMGVGHYRSCINNHLWIPTSKLFFAKKRGEDEYVGLVGGYVVPPYSVVVNLKHDYSNNFLSQALWALWSEYVHDEVGVELNCNGSQSDDIKRRLRMTRKGFYRPPKQSLAGEVLLDARLISNQQDEVRALTPAPL